MTAVAKAAALAGIAAVIVHLVRGTRERESTVGAELNAHAQLAAVAGQPQPAAGQLLAITHNHYRPELHIHPGAEQDAARLIRQALKPGQPARMIPGHLDEDR